MIKTQEDDLTLIGRDHKLAWRRIKTTDKQQQQQRVETTFHHASSFLKRQLHKTNIARSEVPNLRRKIFFIRKQNQQNEKKQKTRGLLWLRGEIRDSFDFSFIFFFFNMEIHLSQVLLEKEKENNI